VPLSSLERLAQLEALADSLDDSRVKRALRLLIEEAAVLAQRIAQVERELEVVAHEARREREADSESGERLS
jgi:hypothetical protein